MLFENNGLGKIFLHSRKFINIRRHNTYIENLFIPLNMNKYLSEICRSLTPMFRINVNLALRSGLYYSFFY